MKDDQRICPACSSADWEDFLQIATGRTMTGDQRIVPGQLYKKICRKCGVVTNGRKLSEQELDRLYGEEYILNTLGKEEHRFFTNKQAVPRSQVFFDWINPHLQSDVNTLLEIGCGEGNVLQRFAKTYPHLKALGLEGSRKACELAIQKGLKVEQGLIFKKTKLPQADVIIAINVLEHVESLDAFLASIRSVLTINGRAIFTLPVQDYPGYDIFFAEHVWHFTLRQAKNVIERNGLEVIFADANHPINHGIGLFICQKGLPADVEPINDCAPVTRNRDFWLAVFSRVNHWLNSKPGRRLALFGASEVTTLLLTFSSLGDQKISVCIDEDSSRQETRKHGMEVVPIEWLDKGEADTVLLAVNPKYHGPLFEKLKKYKVDVFSYMEKE